MRTAEGPMTSVGYHRPLRRAMTTSRHFLLVVLTVGAVASPAVAQSGVAVRIGTRGPGIDVMHHLIPSISIRAGFSYLPKTGFPEFTMERTDLDLAFGGGAALQSWSLMVAYHPPVAGLRLQGGIVSMNSRIEATGRPLESYRVNEVTYTPEELGLVGAEVTYDSRIVPYLGIGLGSAPEGGKLAVQADLGVVFSGSPDFALTGTSPVLPTVEQVRRAREIVDSVKVYPVLSIGLVFGL